MEQNIGFSEHASDSLSSEKNSATPSTSKHVPGLLSYEHTRETCYGEHVPVSFATESSLATRSSDQPNTAFRRRTSSVGLRVNIDINHLRPQLEHTVGLGPADDVEHEGRELAEHFVRQQLCDAGFEKKLSQASTALCSTPSGYNNPLYAKTGKELRIIADNFSKTKERQEVKEKSLQVSLETMNYEQFKDLLTEMFSGQGVTRGVTRERIVVLFCFIGDLAAHALLSDFSLFERCMKWAMNFVVDVVCAWVRQVGGWATLFPVTDHWRGIMLGMFLGVVGVMACQWIRNQLNQR